MSELYNSQILVSITLSNVYSSKWKQLSLRIIQILVLLGFLLHQEGEKAEQSEQEKAMEAKIAELEEKNEDLLDKYRRSLADFENLRNR